MAADYRNIYKALQFVTERNPDLIAPILCKLWDDTSAEGLALVFERTKAADFFNQDERIWDNDLWDDVRKNSNPAISSMTRATMDLIVALATYQRKLDEQKVINRPPLPATEGMNEPVPEV